MRFRAVLLSCAAFASLCAACAGEKEPRLDRAALMDPDSCKECHPDHYDEWARSMHAYASEDPVFIAMNARGQRETNGALGSFCIECHAPMAFRTGASTDGLNLASVEPKLKGVTCFFCHSIDRVDDSHNAKIHLAEDNVLRGGIADPVENDAHHAAYSSLHDREKIESAGACGACHDIVTTKGADLERTYKEWQASVFAKPEIALPCGKCHMDGREDVAAKNVPGVMLKTRTVHLHSFPAIDVALTDFPEKEKALAEVQYALRAVLQSRLCVQNDPPRRVILELDNVGAGHLFPSGASQDRRAWVEMIATRGGQTVYSSGELPANGRIEEAIDPDLWLFRDCIFDEQSQPVSMFWEAHTSRGNGLPPAVTLDMTDPRFFMTHVRRELAKTSSTALDPLPDRITMRVRVQPIGREVLDDLIDSGDLDPGIPAKMPIHELATATLVWTATSAKSILTMDEFGTISQFLCVSNGLGGLPFQAVPGETTHECR